MAANVGDKFLLTLVGGLYGQRIMSTFWYRLNSVTGVVSEIDANDEFRALVVGAGNLVEKYLACCPPEYDLDFVWGQFIAPVRYAKRVTATGAEPGTFDTAAHTANLAATITRRSGFATRQSVGSLHVPIGDTETAIENGLITAGLTIALDALADEMLDVQVTATGSVNWVGIINNQPTSDATKYETMTETFPQETVRVMRRRTVRLGI
jgi:hypothetical protein